MTRNRRPARPGRAPPSGIGRISTLSSWPDAPDVVAVRSGVRNSGDILVHLKPRGERDKDVEEIISEQRARFAQELPAVEIEFVQLLQDMLGDLQGTPEPIEVKIFGDDIKTLGDIAERLEGKLEKIDGLVDLVGPRSGNPELEMRIAR